NAQGEKPAEDRADATRADDRRPRRRAPVVALRDDRAEHEQGGPRHVAETEEDDRRPNPRLPPELVPALAYLPEERLRLDDVRARREGKPQEQRRGDREARRVDGERRAGAAERDEDSADGRA